MKKEIRTEISIQSTPEAVWGVLTDFNRYAEWNPFIASITGEVKEGSRIEVTIGKMKFKPQVLVFRKNEEFRWLGHLGMKGLFDGEHIFELQPLAGGGTKLTHREKFSGILVRLFNKMLEKDTLPGFISMNEALKERVERGVSAH